MLLIHHQQAGPRQRGEDGRTGAYHHRRRPAAGLLPGGQSRALAQARVQQGQRHREATLETCHQLWGQANLRHQYQHLLLPGQYRLDDPQVDLGLATAGHTLQQPGLKSGWVRLYGIQGLLLVRVELMG